MSAPPDDRMSELRQLFFESAGELVQKLNEEAMRLEKSPGDAETARSLRRTVHTLKGDSAACGFRELSELSHEFEDVLTLGNTDAAALVPEIALRAADVFAALLEAYRTGTKLPSIQALRADIARLAHPGLAAESGSKARKKTKKPEAKTVPWTEYEQLAIAQALADGNPVHHVIVQIDPQCAMPIAGRQMIQLALSGLGEVLALYPLEGSHEPVTRIEAALVSEIPAEQIKAKCNIPTIALNVRVTALSAKTLLKALPVASVPETNAADSEIVDSESEDLLFKSETASRAAAALPSNAAPDSAGDEALLHEEPAAVPVLPAGPDHLLRVDAEKIDSVLNLVGELILAKSMLQQTLLEFGQRFPKDALRGKFADAMAFQGRVLNDLQHSVMKIRMVPVDQLFRRFPRIVRDVGRQCSKEVELMVRGGQTDLDKSILDAIAEPLTHLVRNAIGHGIETAEERVRAGKQPKGTLRLGAYHQGNQVVIEVSDDGAGIDAERVRQRALSQGLLTAEQSARLSEGDTLDLILRPGFSTAEEITELSGRGVGLDVVQSVLGRLKGTVEIETAPGKGTTFRLRLPLTLAIIRALMFRVEERLYALPLNAVAEIARTVEGEIHQVEHYDVLQLRNDVLPLLRLGAKPPSGPDTARHKVFVLVINSGERKFGVIVDGLEGEDELVIKALDDQSITTDLVSGASILGDGRVVLILNMIALMERFTRGRADVTGPRMVGLLSSVIPAQSRIEDAVMRSRGTAGGQA
ncbi:MAG: chemotaxis protein CheA [Acidobacteriia bacterium]|nr:chemotaxis protein CheA [Terriglobia bacterium]